MFRKLAYIMMRKIGYLRKHAEFFFQKISVAAARLLRILELLFDRQFSQKQYRFGHIRRQYFPIRQEFFDFSFDFYHLYIIFRKEKK